MIKMVKEIKQQPAYQGIDPRNYRAWINECIKQALKGRQLGGGTATVRRIKEKYQVGGRQHEQFSTVSMEELTEPHEMRAANLAFSAAVRRCNDVRRGLLYKLRQEEDRKAEQEEAEFIEYSNRLGKPYK